MSDNTETTNPTSLTTKLKLNTSKPIPTSYAHHMLVQQDESDVVLSFFEQQLPFIPPNEGEERQKAIDDLQENGLIAECVARIRIAKHRLPLFVKALADTNNRIEQEMKLLSEQYGINKSDDSKN